MLTRSAKSVRSIRSIQSSELFTVASDTTSKKTCLDEPTSHVFEAMLPYVCKKFHCEYDLHVKRIYVQDGLQRYKPAETPVSYKRIGMITPSSIQMPKKADASLATQGSYTFVTVSAIYDSNDSLVEIYISNQRRIPRTLMQAIAVIAPLYENVRKISIIMSKIDAYTIYELNKLVSLMNLTDVCLDDNVQLEANYAILLEKESTLRQLSLCRCSITDEVCQQICSKLVFPAPAENNLLLLSLSGNRITDEGAKYIGEMLRSNRSLRHLNLAGNRIGDDGARYIFDALVQFPLTYDEIIEKRRIILTYFKRKHELTRKFMHECGMATGGMNLNKRKPSSSRLKNVSKTKTDTLKDELKISDHKERVKENAEMLAIELIGTLEGPFYHGNIVEKNGWPYCVGNSALANLNLSYNNLTYISVKKVLNLLKYQSCESDGLIRIVLEGNYLPETCPEYEVISDLLNKKLKAHAIKESFSRKKSRSRLLSSTAITVTGKK